MSAVTTTVPMMSSLEIVELINEDRKAEAAGESYTILRHDNFLAKVESHPGIDSPKFLGQYKDRTGRALKCYHLPKREAELMVMSESLRVQTRVYDRLTKLEGEARPARPLGVDPALSAFRTSRAIASSTKVAESICARFPTLGPSAQQTIYAKLVNAAAGQEVVPLPIVENLLGATEVGKKYHVSPNAIGRLATAHGLKVPAYGEFAMDKSPHSDKQVTSFRYNAAGVARIGELLAQATASDQEAK